MRRAEATKYVEIPCAFILNDTPRAVYAMMSDGTEFWIPRSVIVEEASAAVERDDHGRLIVALWFLEKVGKERYALVERGQ